MWANVITISRSCTLLMQYYEFAQPKTRYEWAVKEAKVPNDITNFRAFEDLINYYGKFISQVPMHMVFCTRWYKWVWSVEYLMPHYDSTKHIKLACNDSTYVCLGVVLSHTLDHGEYPVAFASRRLMKAKRNYSKIEKEVLTVVFGVKKFHKY